MTDDLNNPFNIQFEPDPFTTKLLKLDCSHRLLENDLDEFALSTEALEQDLITCEAAVAALEKDVLDFPSELFEECRKFIAKQRGRFQHLNLRHKVDVYQLNAALAAQLTEQEP